MNTKKLKTQTLDYHIEVGNPMQLGAHKLDGGMNFAMICPDETTPCTLILYHRDTKDILTEIVFTEEMRFGNIFAMLIQGLSFQNIVYNYRIGNQIHTDPYASLVYASGEFGSPLPYTKTCGFYQDKFDWSDDRRLNYAFADSFIYRLHVRGFTMGPASGTRKKGTFLGILDKIPYLQSLGVTMIELLPAYEFNEVITVKNHGILTAADSSKKTEHKVDFWGYRTGDYFQPKTSYAYKKDPASAIKEFKTMVKVLHQKGIEVCMEFYFPDTVPVSYMLDCFRHWVFHYHIDGIHCGMSPEVRAIIQQDPYLARTKIISYGFEPQSAGNHVHLGEYNQVFMNTARKFLKGDSGTVKDMAFRLRYNKKGVSPVNYIASNDSMTLMDLVSYDKKHNEANGENNRDGREMDFSWNCGCEGATRRKSVQALRQRQIKNALAFLFLSQGTPLLYSGDEFGNSCGGNNNPYCQDNSISYLDWRFVKKNAWLLEYVQMLSDYRASHKILHLNQLLEGTDYFSLGLPDISFHSNQTWFLEGADQLHSFGVMLNGAYCKLSGTAPEETLFLAFNMHWEPQALGLPSPGRQKAWKLDFTTSDTEADITKELMEQSRYLTVPPRSVIVLSSFVTEEKQTLFSFQSERTFTDESDEQ